MTPTGSAPWQNPNAAAVADFNGDGKLDAIIGDSSVTIRILLGNGDATFSRRDVNVGPITTSNVVDLNPGFYSALPHYVDGVWGGKVADLNGDGRPDLVFPMGVHLNFAPLNGVSVMLNTGNDINGTPMFDTYHYFLPFSDIRSMTAGDLNGDGRQDFIFGGAYAQVQIYLSNADGTLSRGQSTGLLPGLGGPAVGGGAVADVNGDGKNDFIVASNQNGATDVFLGNGDGTLQIPTYISRVDSINVAIADMNHDNKLDLIEGYVDGSVRVALGDGHGDFGADSSFPTVPGGGHSGFYVADINGDGNTDVAVSLYWTGQIGLLTGNGDGTLGAVVTLGGVPRPVGVTLADFNGDHKPDVGSSSANGYGGQNFAVLTNTTVFAPPLPTQTLTILGGLGAPGDFATNVEYFNPSTGQWQSAYLADFNYPGGSTTGHPWGTIPGTNQWINYRTLGKSDPGAGPTTNQTLWYLYRVRFTVPADAVNPKMTFSLKADNFAQVAINGNLTGGSTRFINGANMPNVIEG